MKVRDLIRLLGSNGWRLKTVRGSHRQFKHPDKRMVVTVAGQSGWRVMTYTAIFEKGPISWGAYVPDLTGVISVGASREKVERLIHQAVELHLEGLAEEGLPIPPPSSFAGEIKIHLAA